MMPSTADEVTVDELPSVENVRGRESLDFENLDHLFDTLRNVIEHLILRLRLLIFVMLLLPCLFVFAFIFPDQDFRARCRQSKKLILGF